MKLFFCLVRLRLGLNIKEKQKLMPRNLVSFKHKLNEKWRASLKGLQRSCCTVH